MSLNLRKKFMWMKGVIAFALAGVLILSICPIAAKAAGSLNWIALGNGNYQLEGTEVVVEVTPGMVHVKGTGVIPDYDYWELGKRPWATNECEAVTIDASITSIGAYVFFGLPKLKYITMSSQTFITDYTTFYNSAPNPVIRIQGSQVTTEMIGTIPYTSMDSIRALAQSGYVGASYLFDSNSLASEFQGSTNPTIKNVFSATDYRAPWNDLANYWNGNLYTSICKFSNPNMSYVVTGTRRYQGKACYQAFASVIADYTFATTFNIAVTSNDAVKTLVNNTKTPYEYVLTIPKEFRQNGRGFRLLAIGKDALYTYDDVDNSAETITFSTDYPTTTYALVYKNA